MVTEAPSPRRLRLELAAMEVESARESIQRLIGEYPDAPVDALMWLVNITAELERIAARIGEVADRG